MIDPARSSPLAAMAVLATVVALHSPGAHAEGNAKPCPTPCLLVNVPRAPAAPVEKAEPGEKKKAEKTATVQEAPPRPRPVDKPKAQAVATAAPAARPPPGPAPAPHEAAAPRPAPSKRCTEINMRAAIGEPLSDQDMKTLRSPC